MHTPMRKRTGSIYLCSINNLPVAMQNRVKNQTPVSKATALGPSERGLRLCLGNNLSLALLAFL